VSRTNVEHEPAVDLEVRATICAPLESHLPTVAHQDRKARLSRGDFSRDSVLLTMILPGAGGPEGGGKARYDVLNSGKGFPGDITLNPGEAIRGVLYLRIVVQELNSASPFLLRPS